MAGSNDYYRVFILNSGIGTQTIAGIQTQGYLYGVYVDNDIITRNISAGIVTSTSLSTATVSAGSVSCTGTVSGNTLSANAISVTNLNVSGGLSANVTGNIRITGAAPTNSNSNGSAGQIRYDDNYIYICVATNTWKRVEITSWTS